MKRLIVLWLGVVSTLWGQGILSPSRLRQDGAQTGECLVWNGSRWAPGSCVGTLAWGEITGTLADQADLKTALDGKASTSHNHDAAYAAIGAGVTGGNAHDHAGGDGAQIAYSSLSGIPATFAPNAHAASHATGQGDALAPANIGAATAADLTTHTGNTSNPHSVTAAQVGNATAQWNANQIQGAAVPDPGAAEDLKFIQYNHSNGQLQWATPGGGGTWGSITGTLSAQTDLQGALDAKAASDHSHTSLTLDTLALNADYTVATLPAGVNRQVVTVTDGVGPFDCTIGGGSYVVMCRKDGVVWAPAVGPPLGGAATWGAITGTLSDQTDLQGELDAKAAAADLTTHTGATDNPHAVTAAQVGNGTAQWNANQIQGKAVPVPGATEDLKFPQYNHSTGQIQWATASGGTGLTDAYATMTDGTNPATASGASTFKLRSANDRLTVATANNDATHGDNALFTLDESKIVHQNISGAGTNDHAAIDTHLGSTSNPHSVTAAQVGAAPAAEGVTGGNAHDHSGGDGAQIDHAGLANAGTNTHADIDTHISATAPHSATSAATPDRIVLRDASGGFSVGHLGFSAGTTAAEGIDFGGDTSLYRATGHVLKTDDTLEATGGLHVSSDGGTGADGIRFGSASDVNLYRATSSILKTDDTFNAAGGVHIDNDDGVTGLSLGLSSDVKLIRFAPSQAHITGELTLDMGAVVGDGSGNDKLAFIAEATNPTCAAGEYFVWANSADTKLKKCENGTITDLDAGGGSGSGDVVGPASSVDSQISLFSGTTGKLIKAATATGVLKASSGVLSAVSGNASDCVKVDGTSGPCGTGGLKDFSVAPAASLTASADATITLTPCPVGVNWNNANHYLRIVDAVGGDEVAQIKAAGPGTCASGAASGTITLTGIDSNHASGNWALTSATSGIQEAIHSSTGPHRVILPAGSIPTYAPIWIPRGGWELVGQGRFATKIVPQTGFPATFPGAIVGQPQANPVFGGRLAHFSIEFPAQPDSMNANDYTQWTGIYWRGVAYSTIENVRIQNAWVGIDAMENAGGLHIDDVMTGAISVGIKIGSHTDTTHIDSLHHTPGGGSLQFFLENSVAIDASDPLSYGNFVHVVNSMCYCRLFLKASASNVIMSAISFDNGQGMELTNGTNVKVSDSYFSIGNASYPAVTLNGAAAYISNSHFTKALSSDVPVISSVSSTLTVVGGTVVRGSADVSFLVANGAGAGWSFNFIDNMTFSSDPAATVTRPWIKTGHAMDFLTVTNSRLLATDTGAVFVEFAPNSGDFGAGGGHHLVANNSLGNHRIVYPTNTSKIQVYANLYAANQGQNLHVDRVRVGPYTFANLPADVADGDILYCSDCNVNSGACAGGGSGALAFRARGGWRCVY